MHMIHFFLEGQGWNKVAEWLYVYVRVSVCVWGGGGGGAMNVTIIGIFFGRRGVKRACEPRVPKKNPALVGT